MSNACGILHLIPVQLGDTDARATVSAAAIEAAAGIRTLEDIKKEGGGAVKPLGH